MAEPIAFPELLGVVSASRMLGVSTWTLKRIPPEQIPYYRVGGRGNRMYRPADINAYLDARRVTER